MMELTEEQKKRMDDNRRRALELLARKQSVQEGSQIKCQNHETCKSKGIDQSIYEVFGELVCSVCKLHSPSFALISRAEANSSYLVTDDALKTIKFQTRDNPHHSSWTPMKLFLRKHVIELSVKRFGSLEKMEEVKKERESLRYEKSLDKTSELLASSTKQLWDSLEGDSNSGIDVSDKISPSGKKRSPAPDQKTGAKKRKKTALNSLVSIIKGTGDD